jgi:hypothetical protein
MAQSNYNGKKPNNTSYIKNFVRGIPASLWKAINYQKIDGSIEMVFTPTKINSVYIPGNLFVDGSIINPSDAILKTNISTLNEDITDKITNLKPSSFEFKDDPSKRIHYGFIAGEFELEYPELIHYKPDNKYSKLKSINYLEIIPLLVHKIQKIQCEIDELKRSTFIPL